MGPEWAGKKIIDWETAYSVALFPKGEWSAPILIPFGLRGDGMGELWLDLDVSPLPTPGLLEFKEKCDRHPFQDNRGKNPTMENYHYRKLSASIPYGARVSLTSDK